MEIKHETRINEFIRKNKSLSLVFVVLIFFIVGVFAITTITDTEVESPAGNFTNLNATDFWAQTYKTTGSGLSFNFYDDGSDVTLNVSSGGDFFIEQDNSKLALFNSPTAGNDFKVFQVFSKEASDVTEFVVTKAKDEFASYFIRSLSLPGNSTSTPTPHNCSTYASYIDCKTDVTGPDFFVYDDIELGGTIYVGEAVRANDWTNVSITESQVSDLSHTTDTGPSPDCAGTTTYQDGEGNCDDISGIYIDESDLPLENQTISYWTNVTGKPFNSINATQMENNGGILNILVSWLTGLFYTETEIDAMNIWDSSTDLDGVIATDEIAEGKIEFTTACAAGSHYYLSGNDLACETDDYNSAFDTEDEIEAVIFDNDNTANLNMSYYNITDVNYIKLNDIGGACDLSINGSICMNATGTYIVG